MIRMVLACAVSALTSSALCEDDPKVPDPESGARTSVYAQYHLWFYTGECPSGVGQTHWSWTQSDDPCQTVVGAPWMRQISSYSYPLIGPYRSDDPRVMRWHIQLAKAAGIDGFFVSVYSWADPRIFDSFAVMLAIAREEGFKLAIEGWRPDAGGKELWKQEVLRQLSQFADESPDRDAYLHINGRPVYWFNRNGADWQTTELRQFLDSRSATWIVAGWGLLDEVAAMNRQLTRSSAQVFITHHVPTTHGWEYNRNFSRELGSARSRGLLALAHGYPGFDETRIAFSAERPDRFGVRNGVKTLESLLFDSAGADSVTIESMNDWNELTQLEPGFDTNDVLNFGQEAFYGNDPYRFLAAIAAFKGKAWETPLPPCSIIDPLLAGKGIACQ